MYRSKIGLVSFENVRKQLGGIFGFVSKVQDDLKDKDEILKVICGGNRYCKVVKGFLEEISSRFDVAKMNRIHKAALCYKFMKECNLEYLGSKFKRDGQPYRQEQFRDLCLRYWGIEEKNTLKPHKCQHLMEEFSSYLLDKEVWGPMNK